MLLTDLESYNHVKLIRCYVRQVSGVSARGHKQTKLASKITAYKGYFVPKKREICCKKASFVARQLQSVIT